MAHFAKLDENNIVTDVLVIHNNDAPTEEAGAQFLRDLFKEPDAVWKKTSYNTSGGVYYNPLPGDINSPRTPAEDQSKSFRKNFASIGGYYDPDNDAFVAPKPFPSWSLNQTTFIWEPPVAIPTEHPTDRYHWNEEIQNWEFEDNS